VNFYLIERIMKSSICDDESFDELIMQRNKLIEAFEGVYKRKY